MPNATTRPSTIHGTSAVVPSPLLALLGLLAAALALPLSLVAVELALALVAAAVLAVVAAGSPGLTALLVCLRVCVSVTTGLGVTPAGSGASENGVKVAVPVRGGSATDAVGAAPRAKQAAAAHVSQLAGMVWQVEPSEHSGQMGKMSGQPRQRGWRSVGLSKEVEG